MRLLLALVPPLLMLAAPALALPEAWMGRWGTSVVECRNEEAANDNMVISRDAVDRYEWSCRIRREERIGSAIRTDVTCSYGDQREAGGILLAPQGAGALRVTFTGGSRFGRNPPVREVKSYRRCGRP